MIKPGERQFDLGVRARRQFEHPAVAAVGDKDVARTVDGHTIGMVQAGER